MTGECIDLLYLLWAGINSTVESIAEVNILISIRTMLIIRMIII